MTVTGSFTGVLLALGLPSNPGSNPDMTFMYICFSFPILTCLMRLMMYFCVFNFDTPKYYMSKNLDEEARDVLSKIYSDESLDEQFNLVENDTKSKSGNVINLKYIYTNLKYPLFVGLFIGFS